MASHVISAGQSLSGNQTITSPSGIFELGFFTTGNSQNYYIGIWYKKLPPKTVVWVANRNQPVSDTSSSTLQLFQNGNLTLLVQSKTEIWSTRSMSTVSHSTVAMLLDNGNFAWMLYTEGRSIEVLDTSVGDSSDPHEVVRSIHVGLSSVQHNPANRPSMPATAVMLSGEGSSPQPQKPGFYSERDLNELEVDPSSKAFLANAVTVLLH
ncbi:hypothetical protein GBA52_003856 [Prunus armeniaca]|nr:hypothetical protein GBA52_003856 [Prunus armeniaca]